jgi:DNA repair exonuclease SbcCD ATPase subunit
VEIIVNNILKDLTYFSIEIKIEYVIIKEKEDIIITINKIKNNDKIEVGGMSVSEKFISNLALRLAFGRLDRNMCVNFLIIDEGFDNCSDAYIVARAVYKHACC